MLWHEFKALGSQITLVIEDNDKFKLLAEAEKEIIDFEHNFSRFPSSSELSAFNNAPAGKIKVSEEMAELISLSLRYYKLSKGIFDPSIIDNLEKFGYSDSFEKLPLKQKGQLDLFSLDKLWQQRAHLEDLKILGKTVIKPNNLRLDFGGLGKGYVIDKISAKLNKELDNKDYWLSAGGDLIASGQPESEEGWKIKIQDPLHLDQDSFSFNTKGKRIALATSGTVKRKGYIGKEEWNHLIDPRSGHPSKNGVLSVSAFAPKAIEADIFAKTALILGPEKGLNFLNEQEGSGGIIFREQGPPLFSDNIEEYLNTI